MVALISLAIAGVPAPALSEGSALLGQNKSLRTDGAVEIVVDLRGSVQNPAWSPDGTALLVTNFHSGYNRGPADLVIVNLTSDLVRVLVANGADNVNLPGSAWNDSTQRIVFASSVGGHEEIYSIDSNGGVESLRQLTSRHEVTAYEPTASPDGGFVVFEAHFGGEPDYGVITVGSANSNGPLELLTDRAVDSRQPNWSPTGELILYQARRDDRWSLRLYDVQAGIERWVTDWNGEMTDGSFSPDGQWIVFSGETPTMEYANLFIVPVTGGTPRRLTNADVYDGAPSWSPDGEKVAFETTSQSKDGWHNAVLMVIDVSRSLMTLPTDGR